MDQLRHRFQDRSQVLLQDLFLEARISKKSLPYFLQPLN